MFHSKKKQLLPKIESQKKKLIQSESRVSQKNKDSVHLNFSQNLSLNQPINLSKISQLKIREKDSKADNSKKSIDSSFFTSKILKPRKKIQLVKKAFSSSDNNQFFPQKVILGQSTRRKRSSFFFEKGPKFEKLELKSKPVKRDTKILGSLGSKKRGFIIKNPNSKLVNCFRQIKSKNKENAKEKKFSIKRKSLVKTLRPLKRESPADKIDSEATYEIEFSLSDFRKISKENVFEKNEKEFSRFIFKNFGSMNKVDEFFQLYFNKVDRIGNNFKNLREIGRGSYAVVYLATDIRSFRELVLKSILLKNFRKPVHVQRFMVNFRWWFYRN